MPNWCQNNLTISHADPTQIARAIEAFRREAFMQEFTRCPQDLLDTMAGSYGAGTPEQAVHEARSAENVAKYGFANWYDWNVANWGTKWDFGGDDIHYTDTSATFSFDTAWSPPSAFYGILEDLGFTVDAFYYEPGMAFCGHYTDGDDDYYEITGDSGWVIENIPEAIDEMFAISENMSDWESEQEMNGDE